MSLSVIDQSGIAAKGIGAANMHTGAVLQVVQGVLADPVVYSAAAWGDIGLSATITPMSSTSKILITVHMQIGGDGSSYDGGIALLRNGAHIANTANNPGSRNTSFMPLCSRSQSVYETASISGCFMDTPVSAAALTYKLQAYTNTSTAQYINRTSADANNAGDPRHISTITLMEIAG